MATLGSEHNANADAVLIFLIRYWSRSNYKAMGSEFRQLISKVSAANWERGLEIYEKRLADNQREANYKKIEGLIRKTKGGITEGKLADKCKAIDGWQRDEIVKDLCKTGRVELREEKTKGRPSRRLIWIG